MKVRAYYEQATGTDAEGNPVIDLFSDDFTVWGELTDEHAACSYGQPVFVRDDGVPMGPAETPALRVVLLDMATAASLLARALAAGFQFAESVSASVEWEQR